MTDDAKRDRNDRRRYSGAELDALAEQLAAPLLRVRLRMTRGGR